VGLWRPERGGGGSERGAQAVFRNRDRKRAVFLRVPEKGETKVAERKEERGFAAMDAAKQREIASKGGLAVSQNREHMAAIGRKGGESSRGGRQRAVAESVESAEGGLGSVRDISR
jgi:hypothetical protein